MSCWRRSVLLVVVCLWTAGHGCSEHEGLAPPIAKAGADRTVEIGELVTLDGSESEPGGSLVYGWTVTAPGAGAVVVSGENAAVSTFVAQVEGVYVATLVVTSNGVDSAPSRAFITAVDTRLAADAGPDRPTYTGAPVALQGGFRNTDLTKFDIGAGTAAYLYRSAGNPSSPCGDLWIAQDGLRIFTRCGNVYTSSAVREDDLADADGGSLEGIGIIRHLDHATAAGSIAVIPEVFPSDNGPNVDTVVRIYDDELLAFVREIELPVFIIGTRTYVAHGRNVFTSADGTQIFVVVQADAASGLVNDFAVATYDL